MSIRVGLRHMARVVGPVAPPPPPPVPMEYVFTEGTASPYDVMYDTIDGVGPVSIAQSESSGATGQPFQRKQTQTSDGTLYAVYHKLLAGKYQIYVKKSVDDGVTWTDETRISTYAGMNSYDQTYPTIAVDSDDNLHVLWHGMATGYTTANQVWYAKYTTSWATPVRISTYTNMASYPHYYPTIAVDSLDYLHVLWAGRATGYTLYPQVWYAKYTTSWATPVRISTAAGMGNYYQLYATMAVDSNDYLHVVWEGITLPYTPEYQVWYAKYTTSWATPVRISTYAGMDGYDQLTPVIAVDSGDYLHVLWAGMATGYTTGNQVWYAKYTTSWATPVRISTAAGMDDYAHFGVSIAVDSSDYLHVLWHGKATGYTDYDKVWYAEYTTSWAAPVVLQPTGQNKYPNMRWSRWP